MWLLLVLLVLWLKHLSCSAMQRHVDLLVLTPSRSCHPPFALVLLSLHHSPPPHLSSWSHCSQPCHCTRCPLLFREQKPAVHRQQTAHRALHRRARQVRYRPSHHRTAHVRVSAGRLRVSQRGAHCSPHGDMWKVKMEAHTNHRFETHFNQSLSTLFNLSLALDPNIQSLPKY